MSDDNKVIDDQTAKAVEKSLDKPKKTKKTAAAALKISELEARVESLEKKIKVVTDGFQFAGDQVRPLYGMGALALVFDAIYKKLV